MNDLDQNPSRLMKIKGTGPVPMGLGRLRDDTAAVFDPRGPSVDSIWAGNRESDVIEQPGPLPRLVAFWKTVDGEVVLRPWLGTTQVKVIRVRTPFDFIPHRLGPEFLGHRHVFGKQSNMSDAKEGRISFGHRFVHGFGPF